MLSKRRVSTFKFNSQIYFTTSGKCLKIETGHKAQTAQRDDVTVILPVRSVMHRMWRFPSQDENAVKEMIVHRAALLYPFEPKDVLFSCDHIFKDPDGYSYAGIWISSCKIIQEHLEELLPENIIPARVVPAQCVLISNLPNIIDSPPESYLLLFIEENECLIYGIENGRAGFFRHVRYGFKDYNDYLNPVLVSLREGAGLHKERNGEKPRVIFLATPFPCAALLSDWIAAGVGIDVKNIDAIPVEENIIPINAHDNLVLKNANCSEDYYADISGPDLQIKRTVRQTKLELQKTCAAGVLLLFSLAAFFLVGTIKANLNLQKLLNINRNLKSKAETAKFHIRNSQVLQEHVTLRRNFNADLQALFDQTNKDIKLYHLEWNPDFIEIRGYVPDLELINEYINKANSEAAGNMELRSAESRRVKGVDLVDFNIAITG